MSIRTYSLKGTSPSISMLAKVLEKNHWMEQLPGLINDSHFEIPAYLSNTLEYKHLLAAFLDKHQLNFSPKTYYIDDFNYLAVLAKLPDGQWILKPSMLNNGKHIHLFDSTHAILQHFQCKQRLGGPHVLQSYIDPPHLLKGPQFGHKYSLRVFVLMTLPYAIFLYPHGYFNICLQHYDVLSKSNLAGHLSNEHLNEDRVNVIQIPSIQYPIFRYFFPKIKKMLQAFFQCFSSLVKYTRHQRIAFLGIDLMLDMHENLYLLEMNHGPCFPTAPDHPLQEKLYQPFWQACYEEILLNLFHCNKKPIKQFHQLC